jgi:hypothetical protein
VVFLLYREVFHDPYQRDALVVEAQKMELRRMLIPSVVCVLGGLLLAFKTRLCVSLLITRSDAKEDESNNDVKGATSRESSHQFWEKKE